jgi:hypothetical protein
MKSRLYAQPPGRASLQLEVELPDDPGTTPIPLKCLSPPPNNQAEHIKWGPPNAWLVTLAANDQDRLRNLSEQIAIVPLGAATPKGGGWPVELSFAAGQAAGRLSWWMEVPSAWGPVQEPVRDLIATSEREASGTLEASAERATDEELGIPRGPAPTPKKKKGLFGRLLG